MWRLNKLASTCFKNSIDDDILSPLASFINISSEIKTNHIDRPIVELINHSESMPDKGVSMSCAKTRLVCYISTSSSGDISAVSTGYSKFDAPVAGVCV